MSGGSTSSQGGGGSGTGMFPMVEKTYRPRITEEIERELRFLGQSRVDALTAEINMTPVKSKGNMRLYEFHEKEFITMKGVTTVCASLAEVMNVLKMETTHKMRDTMQSLFGSMFLDGVVLYTGKDTPARMNESLSVNWMAVQAAKAHLPARDYVFLRYGDVFEKNTENAAYNAQGSGLFVGASIWESIEVDGCAPLPPSQNVTRLRLRRCGIVVEELNHNDHLQVSLFISEPLQGGQRSVTSLTKQWMIKMASSIANFSDAVTSETLADHRLLNKNQFVMDGACCYICNKPFSLLRRKHHCRVCGDVVCSKCGDMKVVRQDGRVKEVRVCITCKKGGHSGQDSSAESRSSPSISSLNTMGGMPKSTVSSEIDELLMSGHQYPSSQTVIHEHSLAGSEGSLMEARGSADMILLKPSENMPRAPPPNPNGMILLNTSSTSSAMSSQDSVSSEFGHYSDRSVAPLPALTPEEMANVELAVTVTENTPFSYALSYSSRQDWPKAPLPLNEAARLAKVRSLHLVDASQQFQQMCEYAAAEMGCQMAAICFIGDKSGFLMAKIGLENREVPRNILFEAHTIMSETPTVVLDATEDIRFVNNPLVKDGTVRFYAGFPLVTIDGYVVGSLTIADPFARESLTGDRYFFLKKLADIIIRGVEDASKQQQMPPRHMGPELVPSAGSIPPPAVRSDLDFNAAQMTMQELLRTAYTTQCQVRMNVEALNK